MQEDENRLIYSAKSAPSGGAHHPSVPMNPDIDPLIQHMVYAFIHDPMHIIGGGGFRNSFQIHVMQH